MDQETVYGTHEDSHVVMSEKFRFNYNDAFRVCPGKMNEQQIYQLG